jgi:hypothetical protein
MTRVRHFLLAAIVVALTAHAAQAVVVDFENSTDVDMFTSNNPGGDYVWDAAAGTGNSGGILADKDGAVWGYDVTAYDLAADGDFVEISLDALVDLSEGSFPLRFGLLADLGNGFGGQPWRTDVDIRNTPATIRIEGAGEADVDLSNYDGHWLRLVGRVEVADIHAGLVDLSSSLYDLGVSGIETPTLLGSHSAADVGNATVLDDNEMYAGFKVNQAADALDNFSVTVPEPATLGLLSLGGLAALRRRRR